MAADEIPPDPPPDDPPPDDPPTTAVAERRGVHWFAGRVHEVLDELTRFGVPVAGLSASETVESVTELLRASARIDGIVTSLLAHAERVDVAESVGATSTKAWLAHAATLDHADAQRLSRLAGRLDDPVHQAAAADLLAGRVDLARAEQVVKAVDALPPTVSREDRQRAAKHLLDEATRHGPATLRGLGKHLLAVVDPDAADAELARLLDAEEREAARKTFLKLRDDGNGTVHGSFRISTLQGAMFLKALHALGSPARPDAIDRMTEVTETVEDPTTGEKVTRLRPKLTAEVLGEAFGQYIERFPTKRLPKAGGVDATVVVTMTLETLLTGLGAAGLDTGGRISPGQARRLACQAGIIPVVLGGKSEPLDVGRRRFHTRAQRIALGLRDRGCTAETCDRPAGWCHSHHDTPYARGGTTTVEDGRLLCPRHHTLVHHPAYDTQKLPDGKLRITRKTRRTRC